MNEAERNEIVALYSENKKTSNVEWKRKKNPVQISAR